MKEKFYITTPIYYPSGKFHIGTAYTTVLTDTLRRYKELRGYDSYMLTGLDEHGQKIQTVAEKEGKEPQEYVDSMADITKKLWKDMNISYSDFIRTTDKKHEEAVAKIFEKLLNFWSFFPNFSSEIYLFISFFILVFFETWADGDFGLKLFLEVFL